MISKLRAIIASLTVILFIGAAAAFAGDDNWKPIDPSDLTSNEPKVEKGADAEAIFWEVRVADEADNGDLNTVLNHYVRFKIFTEKGREENSKVDIIYGRFGSQSGIKIKDIAARTIKPNGSIVELNPSDIFEREVVKGNGIKLKAKSFAVPGIEIGSVVEYKWKEVRKGILLYNRLEFSRNIPVRFVKYSIKPLKQTVYGMRGQFFNGNNTQFVKDKEGFWSTTMSNVPADKDEPLMPPDYSRNPWLLVYYTEDTKIEPEKYWESYGRSVYEVNKTNTKVTPEIKAAAAEAVGDATEPMKKIERIFNYVRAKIKNYNDDALGLNADQKKAIKENKSAADTLKRGTGDWKNINSLFIAMLSAAGFEARIANLPRRSDVVFDPNFVDDYFMRTENVAVKIGEEWKFFDPSSLYVPFGMLSWEEEGQPALISDPKKPIWTRTPLSGADKSLEKQTGEFTLSEDGTLSGTVKLIYTGHVGVFHKEYNDDETAESREKILKNFVRKNFLSTAEVSDIVIENVTDPDKPITFSFKVTVPGYAQRTGKRLFFQPDVFNRSGKPLFTTESRYHHIFVSYPWSEKDELTIKLPDGYTLENADSPAPVSDRQGIGKVNVEIRISGDQKTLYYKRDFSFGNGGLIAFPKTSYPVLKQMFEAFHKVNQHTLTLRQNSPAAPKGN